MLFVPFCFLCLFELLFLIRFVFVVLFLLSWIAQSDVELFVCSFVSSFVVKIDSRCCL